MSYLEELLPDFRKGAKIRCKGWDNDTYIEMNKSTGVIINNESRRYIFFYEDFANPCWELYQEPIDWDYIIKNKCLCLFWDDEEIYIIGTLVKISEPKYQLEDYKYKSNIGKYFKHCRPVRRDELTFYEDRKDD